MWKKLLVLVTLILACAGYANTEELSTLKTAGTGEWTGTISYRRLPTAFEANVGQWDTRLQFIARQRNLAIAATDDGISIFLAERSNDTGSPLGSASKPAGRVTRLDMLFIGAAAGYTFQSEGKPVTRMNYFIGRDPAKWKSGVPSYNSVAVKGLYSGTDFELSNRDEGTEYRFKLAPGNRPDKIQMFFKQARGLRVNPSGELEIELGGGRRLVHLAPTAFWVMKERMEPVGVGYKLLGSRTVGFQVKGQRPDAELVIDPVIDFATYFGGHDREPAAGSGIERPQLALAKDTQGRMLLAASSLSGDIPYTVGSPVLYRDAVIAALDLAHPSGAHFDYVTYLGGNVEDMPFGITSGPNGIAFVCGETNSEDFPVRGTAFDTVGRDMQQGFVSLLDAAGNLRRTSFVQATFRTTVSACQYGKASGPAVAGVYVAGTANPESDITAVINQQLVSANAFQNSLQGDRDAFVGKFTPDLDRIEYFTFLGGEGVDTAKGIVVREGLANVTGMTKSYDFPVTPGAFSGHSLGSSAQAVCASPATPPARCSETYVTRVNADGTDLIFSTMLGDTKRDQPFGMDMDARGDLFVAGTRSTVVSGTPRHQGWVMKLRGDGSEPLYLQQIGNSDSVIFDVAVDSHGRAHFLGRTTEATGMVGGSPLDATYSGATDAFYGRLSPDGFFEYVTYLGGEFYDAGQRLVIDDSDCALLGLESWSAALNGPAASGLGSGPQPHHAGAADVLLLRHCELANLPQLEFEKRVVSNDLGGMGRFSPRPNPANEQFARFELIVRNSGPLIPGTFIIEDTLPGLLKPDTVTGPGCSISGSLVRCSFADLAPGRISIVIDASSERVFCLQGIHTPKRNNRATMTFPDGSTRHASAELRVMECP